MRKNRSLPFLQHLGLFQLTALCSLSIALFTSCSSVHTDARYGSVYDSTYAVASWYGPKFHGRPTSSGDIFNMYAKTCAHKEYPFGTRVKVTNAANNLSAECIVNDRGPFVDGRDIDLSYAVAKEIDMIGTGTARVLLEFNGRDDSYIRPVNVQVAKMAGPFAVQVGAFTDGINAIQLKVALKLKYSNVYIQEVEVKGTTYYRVRVGNYNDYDNALSIAEQLGQEGYQTLLLKADVNI